MPVMTVLRSWKNCATPPPLSPVIFVVTAVYKPPLGGGGEEPLQRAEYIEKPIEPEDLIKAIARHFRNFSGSRRRGAERGESSRRVQQRQRGRGAEERRGSNRPFAGSDVRR